MSGICLRVHAFLNRSEANGPGERCVLWLQGCSIRCAGCCNPATHDPDGGKFVDAATILSWIGDAHFMNQLDGITLTGGEPLDQAESLSRFLTALRRRYPESSVLLYTGYTRAEAMRDRFKASVWRRCDMVISGPYVRDLATPGSVLASSNQKIYAPTKRGQSLRGSWGSAEVIVSPGGSIVQTGVVPDLLQGGGHDSLGVPDGVVGSALGGVR